MRTPVAFAIASIASASVYLWLRMEPAREIEKGFAHICDQLQMQPQDWVCRAASERSVGVYLAASLLVWLALAIPSAVLASTGRRLTAFAPLLVLCVLPLLWGTWSWATVAQSSSPDAAYLGPLDFGTLLGSGQLHMAGGAIADLLLVALPALFVPARRREETPPFRSRSAPRVAVVVCIGAPLAVLWVAQGMNLVPRGALWLSGTGEWFTPAGIMFVFGALLGTNRRWWPWIFAPTGILLSLGLSEALLATISHYTAWTALGASVPYVLIGLIASAWRPLVRAIEQRSLARPMREPSWQWVRPSVVLNGLAAGALGVAILMHVFDPLGIQIATALPTFLGARNAVQDLRTKMNLEEALTAMDSYRSDTGSFAGFEADRASSLSSGLTWRTSGLSASELHPLEVDILSATPKGAAIAAVSPSGTAFCVREIANGSPTFGVATPTRHGSQKLTVSTAMGACGSTPWTPAELRPFPVNSFCDGIADDSIMMCRAVQRSMRQTLATTS